MKTNSEKKQWLTTVVTASMVPASGYLKGNEIAVTGPAATNGLGEALSMSAFSALEMHKDRIAAPQAGRQLNN